jgi:hypothetical protein
MTLNPTAKIRTAKAAGAKQHPPVIALLAFLFRPDFVVGMPVAFEIERFAFVTPSAVFKDFLLAIHIPSTQSYFDSLIS